MNNLYGQKCKRTGRHQNCKQQVALTFSNSCACSVFVFIYVFMSVKYLLPAAKNANQNINIFYLPIRINEAILHLTQTINVIQIYVYNIYFYKNVFHKNIAAEICEILKIF